MIQNVFNLFFIRLLRQLSFSKAKYFIYFALSMCMTLGSMQYLSASEDNLEGLPLTQEQIQHIKLNWTKIEKLLSASPSPHDNDLPANPVDDLPVVTITSPTNGNNLQGTIQAAVNATSPIGISKVEFYIDSVLHAAETVAPYLFSIDTTTLTTGTHEFSAIAYDTNNDSSETAITVQVSSYPFSIYVNAGGDESSYGGVYWFADQNYTLPSNTYSNPLISFANSVYNTERWGNFSYTFNVANGLHSVKLKFAEIYFTQPGQRIFNVFINGVEVISNLDLYKVAGFGVPYDLIYHLNVTNNNIKIDFVSVVNNAKISAIAVTSLYCENQ